MIDQNIVLNQVGVALGLVISHMALCRDNNDTTAPIRM